jgi:[acyl-carrier-protein] S-malonyltransferase
VSTLKGRISGYQNVQHKARQLWQPVRWTETILSLVDGSVNRFIECGPGGVLTDFNHRIEPRSSVYELAGQVSLNEALQVENRDE